jgi:nucleotide-binding universal stress UspA family protein
MNISGSQKTSGNHLTASPISFERILVGTDFSEPAQLAFDIALEFAEQFGSHLSIAHAISLMLPSIASAGIVPEAVDALVQSAKEELDKVIRLHRTNVASIEKVVAFGGAEEVLLGAVREKKIDLLVLVGNSSYRTRIGGRKCHAACSLPCAHSGPQVSANIQFISLNPLCDRPNYDRHTRRQIRSSACRAVPIDAHHVSCHREEGVRSRRPPRRMRERKQAATRASPAGSRRPVVSPSHGTRVW